jgi:hypothetical protein
VTDGLNNAPLHPSPRPRGVRAARLDATAIEFCTVVVIPAQLATAVQKSASSRAGDQGALVIKEMVG